MLVVVGNVVCFLRMKMFFKVRHPKKNAFSLESHYNVGSKIRENDVLIVRYLEYDNGDPPPFPLYFLI